MSVSANPDEGRPDRHRDDEPVRRSFWSSPAGWVALGFIGVTSYFLITEHAAHLFSVLPWLLIAACPLMHLFMHHGSRSAHDHQAKPPEDRS